MSDNPAQEFNVDAMLAELQTPEAPMAMEQAPPPPEPQVQTQPEDPEHEITWKGEKIKLPLSKIKNYAQQAYDYETKMSQLKTERTQFESSRAELEALKKQNAELAEYKKVQDWATQNQGLWDHARAEFEKNTAQAAQNLGGVPNIQEHPLVKGLMERLEGLENTLKSSQETETNKALDEQVEGFKKAHPYLNWDEKNEHGKSVQEQRVYDHAIEKGIGTFEAAAKDLFFDQIVAKQAALAQEKTAKDIQRTNRLGITPLKSTSTTKAISRSSRDLTYDEIAHEALKELNLA